MKFLVDTDWVIDYLRGREPMVDLLTEWLKLGVAISIITYGEIYEGIYTSRNPKGQEEGFLLFLEAVTVLTLTEETMRHFAQVRATLRATGQLIGDADILIAATALEHNLALLTSNTRHFRRVPHLVVHGPRHTRGSN